jgi:hypothetical protein
MTRPWSDHNSVRQIQLKFTIWCSVSERAIQRIWRNGARAWSLCIMRRLLSLSATSAEPRASGDGEEAGAALGINEHEISYDRIT